MCSAWASGNSRGSFTAACAAWVNSSCATIDQYFGDGVETESFATEETAMACRIWLIATTTATAAVIVAVVAIATTATGISDFTLQPV